MFSLLVGELQLVGGAGGTEPVHHVVVDQTGQSEADTHTSIGLFDGLDQDLVGQRSLAEHQLEEVLELLIVLGVQVLTTFGVLDVLDVHHDFFSSGWLLMQGLVLVHDAQGSLDDAEVLTLSPDVLFRVGEHGDGLLHQVQRTHDHVDAGVELAKRAVDTCDNLIGLLTGLGVEVVGVHGTIEHVYLLGWCRFSYCFCFTDLTVTNPDELVLVCFHVDAFAGFFVWHLMALAHTTADFVS